MHVLVAASVGWTRVGTTSITTTPSLPKLPMLWILLLSFWIILADVVVGLALTAVSTYPRKIERSAFQDVFGIIVSIAWAFLFAVLLGWIK